MRYLRELLSLLVFINGGYFAVSLQSYFCSNLTGKYIYFLISDIILILKEP